MPKSLRAKAKAHAPCRCSCTGASFFDVVPAQGLNHKSFSPQFFLINLGFNDSKNGRSTRALLGRLSAWGAMDSFILFCLVFGALATGTFVSQSVLVRTCYRIRSQGHVKVTMCHEVPSRSKVNT